MQHLEEAYDRMLGRHPKKPSKFNSPTFWLDHIRSRPLWRLSYEKHLEDLAPVMREEFETLKTVIQCHSNIFRLQQNICFEAE